jgi:hypothetical protein
MWKLGSYQYYCVSNMQIFVKFPYRHQFEELGEMLGLLYRLFLVKTICQTLYADILFLHKLSCYHVSDFCNL